LQRNHNIPFQKIDPFVIRGGLRERIVRPDDLGKPPSANRPQQTARSGAKPGFGRNGFWERLFLGAIVFGSNYIWEQQYLGATVFGSNRI
jgi:hypothetical protein